MPIGLVSNAEFEAELARLSGKTSRTRPKPEPSAAESVPVVEGVVTDKVTPGRSTGDTNVPDSLRKIIGEEAVINGRKAALKIATEFGISASSVSAYTKGATSTATINQPKPSIVDHINKSRTRAIKRASTTLNAALGSITQEKLDYADAKDLSTIAKDMSVVIRNLEPQKEQDTIGPVTLQPPQFVIFAPQFKDERTFETITVQE